MFFAVISYQEPGNRAREEIKLTNLISIMNNLEKFWSWHKYYISYCVGQPFISQEAPDRRKEYEIAGTEYHWHGG